MWVEGTGMWMAFRQVAHHLYTLALTLGGPGLFLVALADSSLLSLPEANDYLIVLLSAGQSWSTMCLLVGLTVLGSVAGCALLYNIGQKGGSIIKNRTDPQSLRWVGKKYSKWGAWAILLPSLLPPPTPFKIFVLAAGVFRVSFSRFLLMVSIARSIRYFTWGVLAVLYGEWVERALKAHQETIGTVLILLLLAGIAGYFVHRSINRDRNEGSGQHA